MLLVSSGVGLVCWAWRAVVGCKDIVEKSPRSKMRRVSEQSSSGALGTELGCVRRGGAVCLTGKVFLEWGVGCRTPS